LGEEKKLALAKFLTSSGEDGVIAQKSLTLEEAKDIQAVGQFTFGDITTLFYAQGHSRGEVMRFLREVETGALSADEAIQFLNDCKEWESTKRNTDQNRDEFFAEKFAAHEAARKRGPSRN